MNKLKISGGQRLDGEVVISGAKNAALPILAGCLLAEKPVMLRNIPHLRDVTTTIELLSRMGVEVTLDDQQGVEVDASGINNLEAPYELVKTMRASILVLGPLLTRFGRADVSLPGGCAIGARPVDLHVAGLREMGADIQIDNGYIRARARRLHGARLVLDTVTVTGTENLLMAATLARGTTVINNAAREPEIVDLADCLIKMGAQISGVGTSHLMIDGVERLGGTTHPVVADRIEAGTFAVAAGITGGELILKNGRLEHLESFAAVLEQAGVICTSVAGGIHVVATSDRPVSANVTTAPYPGFAPVSRIVAPIEGPNTEPKPAGLPAYLSQFSNAIIANSRSG